MARLPIPGSDEGNWGNILNDYLSQVHDSDGTIKSNAVSGAAIVDGSVTETKLSGALQSSVAGKADDTAVVHLAGTETIAGAKTFSSAVTVVAPTDAAHATTKSYVDTRAVPAGGATGQVLSKNDNADYDLAWVTPASADDLPWFNAVTDYSADNTGATDARAAIQSAIDAANAAGGGVVYLPAGDYRIDYTANAGGTGTAGGLQMKGHVWLKGDGRGTRIFPAGTWSTMAGVIGIGDWATSVGGNLMYNVRVSDMFIKAEAGPMTGGTRIPNTVGVLFNTYNGASVTEPDAAHIIHDLLIWDMDTGMAIIGIDDQGMHVQRIRIRRCINQCLIVGKPDDSGGGPDNFFHAMDMSSGNIGLGTAACVELYASNCHFVECKVWYGKRGSAFTAGATYKDGAGWYIRGTRNTFVACEAQDNGGHGFLLSYGKNSFSGCIADSNSYYDNVSGSAAVNECSGFYISSGASSSTITGALAFSRSVSHIDQKYGYYIDSSVRSIQVEGVAYDNAATTGAGVAADGIVWSGAQHATQVVSVVSSHLGSNYTHISNALGGTGTDTSTFEVIKSSSLDEDVVTGTTLVDDPALIFTTIPGGSLRYRVEGYLKYRADAATDAQFAVRIARNDGTSTTETLITWEHLTTAGAVARTTAYSAAPGTVGAISADGAGTTGTANIRSVQLAGDVYVGSTVTTLTFAIQSAENSGTGGGVVIHTGSWLRLIRMD